MKKGERFNPYKNFAGVFIPNSLLRIRDLSQGAKICWGRLAQYAGENGEAWPSHEKLGQELGVTDRQTRDYLNELKEKGFIEIVRTQKSNKYYFLWNEALEDSLRLNDSTRNNTSACTRNNTSACTRNNTSDKENHLKESEKESSSKDAASKPAACEQPSLYIKKDEEQEQEKKENAAQERAADTITTAASLSEEKEKDNSSEKVKPELYQAIDYYIELFEAATGQQPHIKRGQDHKLLKGIITSKGINKTLELLKLYFEKADSFTREKQGYSIGYFAKSINRLITLQSNGGKDERPQAWDNVKAFMEKEQDQGPVYEAAASREVDRGPAAAEEAPGYYDPDTNTYYKQEAAING